MEIIVLDQGRLARALAPALATAGLAERLVLVSLTPEAPWTGPGPPPRRRYGDPADLPSLPAALAGGATLVLPGGGEGAMEVAATAAMTEAARAFGVERIVLLSSIDPRPGNPAPWAAADRTAEAMVRASGLGWTVLRLQERLEDFVAIGRSQQPTGRMFANRGGGASAPIALADAAAALAAALADASHAGRTYDLTGPDLITTADLAAALGIADITHKDGKYLEQLIGDGRTRAQAEAEVALGRAVREGYYAVVSGDAQALSGRTPGGLTAMLGGPSPTP